MGTRGEIGYHREKKKMENMVDFLKGCDENSFPVGFDRDLLYPPVVNVIPYNADGAATNIMNNSATMYNNNVELLKNAKASANENTTSSMLMSTTAISTLPCPKKRKISSNPNTNNTNNVVVNAPFDSSSFSYDGVINPLKTPLSQHPHQHQQQQQQYQQHQQTSSSTHPLPTNTINNNGIYNIGAPKNGLPKQQIPLTSDFLQNPQ